MKVLQVTSTAQRRGAEVFARQLGDELTSRGHCVTTVALEPSADEGELGFADLSHGRGDPRAISRLVAMSRSTEVIVSHGGSTLAVVAVCSRLARRPFVYRNIGDPGYWGAVRGAQVRVGVPLRAASRVVALYQDAERYMITRYRLDPGRVTVSPNAVDVDRFPPATTFTRAEARAAYGLDAEQPVVGYLGNLSPEKRPQWALDVAEQIQTPALLMAGDGPLRDELADRIDRLVGSDDTKSCQLVGRISDPARFLSALDVLLLPSITEGIPGVLLEAALVGVPTVATDVGGVATTMATTRSGRCVAADDQAEFVAAVRSVLETPGDRVPDRGAVIRNHSIARVADDWERILSELVGP